MVDVDERLIRVQAMAAGMYPETQLAQAGRVVLGEGTPPGAQAWAVIDNARLAAVTATNDIDTIAESIDPAYQWRSAVSPPPGHPLATAPNIVYVLEGNRVLDIDRVLVLTKP